MQIEAKIRKLARSAYYQNLYKASKEGSGVHLFKNVHNFSGLQSRFLYWLMVYDILYDEMAKLVSPYLDEEVINDDERTNAYLYYRKKKQESEWRKFNQEKQSQKVKNKSKQHLTTFDVDMRRP